jgi:hypothetical protein
VSVNHGLLLPDRRIWLKGSGVDDPVQAVAV